MERLVRLSDEPLTDYAGQSLESPFDADMDGLPRGGDGVWDRGAFEYVE